MSKSPVLALRILQNIIVRATGVDVPLLNLTKAMVEQMGSKPSLVFPRESIRTYYNRLRSWRAADLIVIHRFHTIRRERRATLEDMQEIYGIYKKEAEAQGLVPLGFSTFRLRAYLTPVPSPPPSPLPRIEATMSIPILCVDFDGVLHSYRSGWKGARNIPDPPVAGAIEWLNGLVKEGTEAYFRDFDVCIFSSRNRYLGGARAMRKWLVKWGFPKAKLQNLRFPLLKPPAHLYIDDRAMCFMGQFPSTHRMLHFKPWNKK